MESITGRTEHWRFRKVDWQKPDFAQLLPAPEHFLRGQRKIWEQRDYGLWIGEKIDLLGEYHPLKNAERELLKSRIAGLLIDLDRKYFVTLAQNDPKKRDFDFISTDNAKRSEGRSQDLFDLIAPAKDQLPNVQEELDLGIAETAGMFVRDCMRSYNQDVNRDALLTGNLERNLAKIRARNEKLMQIIDFPSGVYGVFRPVHSHKN